LCYKADILPQPLHWKHNFHTNKDDCKDEAIWFSEHLDKSHKAVFHSLRNATNMFAYNQLAIRNE